LDSLAPQSTVEYRRVPQSTAECCAAEHFVSPFGSRLSMTISRYRVLQCMSCCSSV
jgi:hypothetical protein